MKNILSVTFVEPEYCFWRRTILQRGPRLGVVFGMRTGLGGRGGSRIFNRRGCTRLLLYFATNKPLSFFFWQNTSCIRKRQVISGGGGGVRAPCTHPRDPPRGGVINCQLSVLVNFSFSYSTIFLSSLGFVTAQYTPFGV